MRFQRILLPLLIITTCFTLVSGQSGAPQNTQAKLYQQMTQPEQKAFVAEQAGRIAREISGTNYPFTTEFEIEIQKAVASYTQRIGNSGSDSFGKGDVRFILERGQVVAPTLIATFKTRNVSPLIGLYLPFIESEYVNLQSPKPSGAVGMFQFLPKTGEHYGLRVDELMDVEKSADAAARYIAVSLKRFSDDGMKEALALLAYNRGENSVERDLQKLVNEQNRACSICALTVQGPKLDATLQSENDAYVPRFFAAAIIGENPQTFGLHSKPLSSY